MAGNRSNRGFISAVGQHALANAKYMAQTSIISDTEKLACVERELKYRKRVYARLVAAGKMTAYRQRRELELMAAIVEDYKTRVAGERLL